MTGALLPTNATAWEAALADAMVVSDHATAGISAMRRIKYLSPRASMLPFLVWEYGLGELTPYVPNLYQLIDEGVNWQRVRGTVSAVAIGLAWLGYHASLEEAWTGRRWWNSFQLRFDGLPAQDYPDLERIEAVAALSVPKRSQLRRGVFGYDVPAAQANHTRFNRSMWNFESGVAFTEAGTLWSFGRCHEFTHRLTEAEGLAIGNWIEPPVPDNLQWGGGNWIEPEEDTGSVSWSDLVGLKWVDALFPWSASLAGQRRAALAAWFTGQTAFLRLSDASGGIIGYRRCRALRAVRQAAAGAYRIGVDRYNPETGAEQVYFEAMTGFDDVDGVEAASVAIHIGGVVAAGVPSGRQWLSAGQLSGGVAIATQPFPILLRRTVREQIKILMRF